MLSSAEGSAADRLAASVKELESVAEECRELGRAAELAPEPLSRLLDLAVRLYSVRPSAETPAMAASADGRLTPTEAVTAITHLLKEASMDLFEVGLWQTWGRR